MNTALTGIDAPKADAAPDDLVKDTTTQAFAKDVLEASRLKPVLVDFWAPWCGPCKTLSPIIEKAVRAAKGAVRLVKMNIDDHPAIAGQLGIQSIPAVIAFVNGQPVDGFIGALPESQVTAFINRIAGPAGPSDADRMVEMAAGLFDEGDFAAAAEAYKEALRHDPQSVTAMVGLAKSQFAGGDAAGARHTLAGVPEAKKTDPAVVALGAQLDLAEQAGSLGDAASLEARLAADPNDHQARFDLALLRNAAGDRTAAVDHLLEIMRRNRSWSEEKARKQLLQFFEAWGPADEATSAGRRKLSSVLFA